LKVKWKYKIIFLNDVNGILTIVKIKRIKVTTKKITFRKKGFIIDTSKVIRKGNILYCFVDLKNQQIELTYEKIKPVLSPEAMKTFIGDETITQIVNALGVKKSIMEFLIYLVCGLGVGLFIGYILAGFI